MDEPEFQEQEGLLEQPQPNSSESEDALIGSVILDNALIFEAIDLLKPEAFFQPTRRMIFKAMIACFQKGKDITPVSINEELKKQGESQSVGGVTVISKFTDGLPHTDSIAHYAEYINDTAKLRDVLKATDAITQSIYEGEDEPKVILARAEQRIFDVTSTRYKSSLVRVGTLLDEVIEDAHSNVGVLGLSADGLDTGFIDINRWTAGFQKQDLIILAGRPGSGKTSLADCICANVSIRQDKLSAYFSLEMSKKAVIARILCSEAQVDHERYRKRLLNHEEWMRIEQARAALSSAPIFIDDTPAISVLEMRAKCLRLAAEEQKELALSVVDYLQLMTGSAEHRRESRQQEVSGISRDLKGVAKILNVPLLALSQLSRALESRQDKRPQLADLRESGALEQDADVVGFLYREAMYTKELSEDNQRIAELNFAKQRNGPPGVAMLRFEGKSFRFDNLQTHNF